MAVGCEEKKPEPKTAPPRANAGPTVMKSAPEEGKRYRIAVVPKGTTHDFWKSIHAGAVKAAKDLGNVDITWQGPEKEDDREQQVSLVQNLISAKYDAIC